MKVNIRVKINVVIFFILVLLTLSIQANTWDKLFDYDKYQNTKISPDGKYLAVSVLTDNKRALAFLDRKTFAVVGGANFQSGYEVGNYHWANNERVVINMVKRKGWREQLVSYGELYAINFDGSRGEKIFGYGIGEKHTGTRLKKKKSINGWGEIIDVLPDDKDHILISSTRMNNAGDKLSTVYKLNIYSGILKDKLSVSPLPYARFITDVSGEIRAVIGTNDRNQDRLYIKKDRTWEMVSDKIVGAKVNPLSISASGKYLYTIDDHNQDLRGIFRLNLDDYSYKNIFTDKDVDISGIEMSTDGRTAYAAKLDVGYPSYVILNKKTDEAKVYKDLIKSFPFSEIWITSKSEDNNFYTVYVSSDIMSGRTYIFDKQKNDLKFLFEHKIGLKNSDFVQTEPIEFNAADGQKINGYFTAAKTTDKEKIAPVVILVHGGPHGVRDYWGFSSEVQYLALNGYSVLQINYRGSGGYGYKFESSGHKAWGSISQQDIYDGYQWLVKQNKAIANNVCIMGASFGAYSAIQSATLYPDTYKCAVANAGVYDLELMFEEGDIQKYGAGVSYLEHVLGTDKDHLKSMSPINYAEKINIPLLLAHGEKDERAPIEHAERLSAALDKANKPYEWFAIDKEGHGFFNPTNQKAYMSKVISFLDENLK
jgi:dienelactone hydrolase